MKKTILFALFITASFLTTKAQYTKMFDFDTTSGSGPYGSLISDGTFLYGMAQFGSMGGCLFGFGCGAIFKINSDGTGYTKLLDFDGVTKGSGPAGDLIFDGTFLYGMAGEGGTNNMGVVFKIKPDGTGYTKLKNFGGVVDGRNPRGSLVSDGTLLYGMTALGGANDMGVIFKIQFDGTGFTKLLDFNGTLNGNEPNGSLIFDGTFLYGMTAYGGTNNLGVVFKIKPDGTGFAKLLDFDGTAKGEAPWGSLISDGTFLYGMTSHGGTGTCFRGCGVIFKIKPDGTGYAKLHDFAGAANGSLPRGSLISDGTFLYGFAGGLTTSDFGVLFKIKPDGTGFAKLFDFDDCAVSGCFPFGSLLSDSTFLYGMTNQGGTNNTGAIFKYALATGIAEHPANGGFNVYPNPTSGRFTIERDVSQGTKGEAEIYNVMGEKVHQQTLNSKLQTLNLNLPGGIYFIHILTAQGTASRKMVVSY